jgi:uncharacterized repeat protein (TIGR03837 family)
VRAFLGGDAGAGATRTRGALTVHVLPFVPQTDYDKLLWACDVNFVRGEDSWVRAQWAARPFIWHIYPQDENLHHKKLRAFLQRYAEGIESVAAFSLHWNGATQGEIPSLWKAVRDDLPGITARTAAWEAQVLRHGDLVSNLLSFVKTLR